jgi:IMP dehydrogenase
MLSICTPEMSFKLSNDFNTLSSYHRFFQTIDNRKQVLTKIKNSLNNKDLFFVSIGTKPEEYNFIDWLAENKFKSIIIDVNHGHHKMVADILTHIKKYYCDHFTIMAGNVSSVEGIKFLKHYGADVIKIGNSFGGVCTTIKVSGVGVHPIHTTREYRKSTGDWNTKLCVDGGIRNVADIAKSLIWGDFVMLGSMLAGSDESYGELIQESSNGVYSRKVKQLFGNASLKTKQTIDSENHVRYVEGITKLVPYTGPLGLTLNQIIDGLQSSFSFMNARNMKEYKLKAENQVLYV